MHPPGTQPYEYSDYNRDDKQSLTFDSYMIPEDDLELGQLRLLEVLNPIFTCMYYGFTHICLSLAIV